ncbi:adenylate/guanylate cyclase domain-containing protein [Ottowia sp.]|uniref:adenylate/guanylate cyclase domain-containing protein n=1 Tax=Ottowia sp. TaxID=1898956 RepID=UPI002611815E|nr:adenylate/guanylate cyclase domain-containing protein [Ottowia sp.]
MADSQTILFVDLTGSTAAYQAVDGAQVAAAISKVTAWVGRVCEAHAGRVIKFLGDGVLAQFDDSVAAVRAAIFMQRSHSERIQSWPEALRMPLKVGISTGAVVQLGGDTYGDTVNLASRLSDMAGPHAIWANETVIERIRAERQITAGPGTEGEEDALNAVRYRSLGMMRIRGLDQAQSVFQVEWNEDVSTDLLTVRGTLTGSDKLIEPAGAKLGIALAWLGYAKVFSSKDMPVEIGRIPNCAFVVGDQRVSRQHARLEWINGAFVLTDTSSFGTWVRFVDAADAEVQLRRNQCVLHSTGEIALGSPFSDFSAPVVAFHIGSNTA